jgi:hypothetical protein
MMAVDHRRRRRAGSLRTVSTMTTLKSAFGFAVSAFVAAGLMLVAATAARW